MTILSRENLTDGQTLRQKVSDIYTKKVVTCLPMDSIRDLAKKMIEAKVSSVVVKAFNGKPIGIITEKDLVRKVLSAEVPDLERKAHEIMSPRLVTVRPDDFTYQALLMMVRHNISHIVVTSDHDVLDGIVTIKDLIRTHRNGAISIVGQIEQQDNFSGIAALINETDQVQRALLSERAYASEICALINELYDRVTRKVIQMAEEQLVSEGWGAPPAKYCFINMGSAGRKEQYSRTDQDNGIIFEDSKKESAAMAANYFLALGKRIVLGLEECGFKRCIGEVMADNPRWCLPISMWKNNLKLWVDRLDGRNIRNMTIFLDYRNLAGDAALFEDLKRFTTRLFRDSKHALLFMAEDDLKHRVPLNIFGKVITEKSRSREKVLNLKNSVMVHLVDCIRIFSLREGLQETNSFERIHRLKERWVFKPDDAESIEAAYEALLMFRIRDAAEKMNAGSQPDNFIDPGSLTKKDKALLKESLAIVNHLQSLTAHAFHVHKA